MAFRVAEVRDDKKDLTVQLSDRSWSCISNALTVLQPFIPSGEQHMLVTTWAHGVVVSGLVTTVPEVANCGACRDAELHM